MKTCQSCGTEKPESEYHKKRTRKDGLAPDCKICANASRSVRKKRTPNKKSADEQRKYHLNRTYGITLERYQEMHDEQGGVCAICKQPETCQTNAGGTRMLAVDHDHETGEVRGLLCRACNVALGLFRDNAASLARAIEYLNP